ncbi:MAG: FG-GAP-like repeat-containing protein [Gemmataceae bacterium]
MISAGNATFSLNSGTTNVLVTRTGDLSQQVTIAYSITDGTAINGTNFTAAPTTGTLIFPAGATVEAIPISVLPGNFPEASRDFSVDLLGVVDVQGPPATFAAKQGFSTGQGAYSVVSADVDNDGKADLIVANRISNSVSVLLNRTAPGAGTASFTAKRNFATGTQPTSVAVTDVNGDGKADLIVANNGSNTVSVLINATVPGGAASFIPQKTFQTGQNPAAITSADVNGDGKADLIVTNFGSNSVSVLLNTTVPGATTPTFTAQRPFGVGSRPAAVTTTDLNGDGKVDLVVANRASNMVSVLLNMTAAGAATPTFLKQKCFATDINPVAVSAADMNGDGKADLLVANSGSDTVSVLLNTTTPGATTPTFAPQQTFAAGSEPTGVTATDANGDGKLDLVVTGSASKSVAVLLNTTRAGGDTLTFANLANLATGINPSAVTTSDVNGDGRPDIIVANCGSNTVSVMLNTTSHSEPTLIGVPSPLFPEVGTVPTGREPNSVSWTDVNGDGKPDLVVSNFGSNTVSVSLNTTVPGAKTPTFAPEKTFATGSRPFSVASADVNGDGLSDLVVANVNANTVSVLLNTTAPGADTPSFAAQKTFATGTGPEAVLLSDVNGDGRPDLLVANNGSNTMSVLLNTTAPGAATPTFTLASTFATGINPAHWRGPT